MNDSPPCASSTSLSLIERAQAHDPAAWERIAQLYVPLVYGWTRRTGIDATEAADIVQEVFRSVMSNVAEFRHDGPNSSFRGWLWTITRNQVRLTMRRRAQAEVTGGEAHRERIEHYPDPLDLVNDPSTTDQKKSLLQRALRLVRSDFQETTWQAFWRFTVDEEPAAEVARDLGMTPKAVRQAKYRVLSRLRQELGDEL